MMRKSWRTITSLLYNIVKYLNIMTVIIVNPG